MLLLFLLITPSLSVIIDETKIKEFKWRGPPVIDETIFTNPNSFDYDFTDDLKKPADFEDIYDQNVGQLPNFNVFKLGKDEGYTKVPIVTRRWQTWSTVANTRGPLDFFATPSTAVMPVFITTEAPVTMRRLTTPMSTKPTTVRTTTTTTQATTTTERPTTTSTVTTTTRRPTTTTTPRPTSTTTRRTTTTTTQEPTTSMVTTVATTTSAPSTTERFFFHRERIVHQPPPAFKTGRGPIWRKGGRIEFEETSTLATTMPEATTSSFFRRRPFGSFHGIHREMPLRTAILSLVGNLSNRQRQPLRQLQTTTTEATTTITRLVGNLSNRHPLRQLQTTTTESPTTIASTTTARPLRSTHSPVPLRRIVTTRNFTQHPAPKPIIIHHGANKYRGPTYNCRVLNPFEDGRASPEHDNNCKMLYPGMSSDGNCRCFYRVSERDEHGCAMGFLYACRPLDRTSVVV